MIFPAHILARGWLAVSVAGSDDKARPQFYRTVYVEQYLNGVLLTSTDSYMLLHSWVPAMGHEFETGPSFDEAPEETAVVMDPYGRGRGFMGHIQAIANKAAKDEHEPPPVEVRMQLGVSEPPDEDQKGARSFDSMTPDWCVLEYPDHERLKLPVYEGDFPNWRSLMAGFKEVRTALVSVSGDVAGRLAKASKAVGQANLGLVFGGKLKPIRVEMVDADPWVEGLVMPCRWDMDANQPWVPDPDEDPAEGLEEGEPF